MTVKKLKKFRNLLQIKENRKIQTLGSKNPTESFSKEFMIVAGFSYNRRLKIRRGKQNIKIKSV